MRIAAFAGRLSAEFTAQEGVMGFGDRDHALCVYSQRQRRQVIAQIIERVIARLTG
jgi:hypothetical protein